MSGLCAVCGGYESDYVPCASCKAASAADFAHDQSLRERLLQGGHMTWWDHWGTQHEGSPPDYDMTNGQDYDAWEEPEPKAKAKPRREPGTWRPKDGRVLRICDMDNQHLANTIRMLRRRAEQRRPEVELAMTSFAASCRGDAATDAAESEERMVSNMDLDDFCGYLFNDVWHELIEEAERRKLTVTTDQSKLRISVKTIRQALTSGR